MKPKKATAVFMAAVLAFGLCPASAFASDGQGTLAAGVPAALQTQAVKAAKVKKSATTKMRTAYKKVLKQANKGTGKFKSIKKKAKGSSVSYYCNGYVLYDIDKNGTPEMLVNVGSYSLNTAWFVFTMKSGKIKYSGRFGDGQTTLAKGKGKKLYAVRAHMGAAQIELIKLKNKKVKTQVKVSDSNVFTSNKISNFTKKNKFNYLKWNSSSSTSAIDSAVVK